MTTMGIIGGGNMGEAMMSAFKKDHNVIVCEKNLKRQSILKKRHGVKIAHLKELIKESRIVFIAVKPQDIRDVLDDMRFCDVKQKLIISVAAGISTSLLEKTIGGHVHVVRAMPNLPVKIRQGVIALSGGRWVHQKELKQAQKIFALMGKVFLVKETMMDAVTAVSGSGPGYVYFFAEQMIISAKKLGFSQSVAEDLVVQTFLGSALLLAQSSQNPQELRVQVASKGGTTQEALNVFLNKKMDQVFYHALKAARDRSRVLSRRPSCAK